MRKYKQRQRAENTAQTRRLILQAARQLFLRAGFFEVSIDAVAEKAGVGRTTVFAQFGSKKALLRACVLEVSADAGVEDLMRQLASPDPMVALRAAFAHGCRVWAAEARMFRKLNALAEYDATLRAVLTEKTAGRYENVVRLVDRLPLRVPKADAYEMMGVLTSFEAFAALHARTKSVAKTAAYLLRMAQAFVATG